MFGGTVRVPTNAVKLFPKPLAVFFFGESAVGGCPATKQRGGHVSGD
jgi:hypothetical protein